MRNILKISLSKIQKTALRHAAGLVCIPARGWAYRAVRGSRLHCGSRERGAHAKALCEEGVCLQGGQTQLRGERHLRHKQAEDKERNF